MHSKKWIVGAFVLSFLLTTNQKAGAQQVRQWIPPQPPMGVKVTEVFAGWPADKAGIQVGDTLVEVNGIRVANVDQVRRALRRIPGIAWIKLIDVNTEATVTIPVVPVGGMIGLAGRSVYLLPPGVMKPNK